MFSNAFYPHHQHSAYSTISNTYTFFMIGIIKKRYKKGPWNGSVIKGKV